MLNTDLLMTMFIVNKGAISLFTLQAPIPAMVSHLTCTIRPWHMWQLIGTECRQE